MTTKKINHDHKCDCGKPATINVQNYWHKYDIDNEGNFSEVVSWEGDDNSFYCNACYDKEFNNPI